MKTCKSLEIAFRVEKLWMASKRQVGSQNNIPDFWFELKEWIWRKTVEATIF